LRDLLARLGSLRTVGEIRSPLTPGNANLLSRDGRSARRDVNAPSA
jgi:hypothetical protein